MDIKQSFDPILDPKTTILVLGTMPSDKSLALAEYYGNPRNRFWKIIATITNNKLPLTYFDKKELLAKTGVGVWDVVRKASRKGSLDSAIENEEPNDLDNFIAAQKSIKVIGFNGAKSEALFNKYFDRKPGIRYVSLPSSSPANAGIGFDALCNVWRQLLG